MKGDGWLAKFGVVYYKFFLAIFQSRTEDQEFYSNDLSLADNVVSP